MTIAEFPVPPVVKTVSVRIAPARAFELFARDLPRWWPLAQFHTGPDPVECAIEPRISPEGPGTRVELTHSGWEKLGDAGKAAALRERYDRGWATLIERCYAE